MTKEDNIEATTMKKVVQDWLRMKEFRIFKRDMI